MQAVTSVDLNADVGRGANDVAGIAIEGSLLAAGDLGPYVACGGHAGDEDSMPRHRWGRWHSACTWARPVMSDRAGFGRQADADETDLPRHGRRAVAHQLTDFVRVCEEQGAALRSVKAHGALYGEVAKAGDEFEALLAAVRRHCPPGTFLVLPAGSAAVAAAAGGRSAIPGPWRGSADDRATAEDGTLVDPPARHGTQSARDPERAARQAMKLVGEVGRSTPCVCTGTRPARWRWPRPCGARSTRRAWR